MRLGNDIGILEEIGWECGRGDEITAGFVVNYIVKMGCALLDKLHSRLEWHKACVLGNNEKMESVAHFRRSFHKIEVAVREWVCIHHDSTLHALRPLVSQLFEVIFKACALVFHKDNAVFNSHDFVEAEAFEKLGLIALRIEKDVGIALFKLILKKVSDDFIEKALALIGRIDGKTAECIHKCRACRHKGIVFVKKTDCIIKISVLFDAFLKEKGVQITQCRAVMGANLTDFVIKHSEMLLSRYILIIISQKVSFCTIN